MLLLEATLKAFDSKLGPDHPVKHICRRSCAAALQDSGKVQQALPLFEAVLRASEAKFGPNHPETLTSRSGYAQALSAAGRLEQALPLLEATLKAREAKLGAEHPETLTSRFNYAMALRAAGKLEQAVLLYLSAAAGVVQRQFQHPHAAPIVGHAIVALESMEDSAAAEGLRRQWIRHLRQGPANAALAGEIVELARNLISQNKPADAEPHFREALAVCERLLAAKSPQVLPWEAANGKSELGGCLSAQKKFAEALPVLQAGYDGLAKDAAVIPAEFRNQILAEAAERLAKYYTATGDAAKAKEWEAKAEGHRKAPAK